MAILAGDIGRKQIKLGLFSHKEVQIKEKKSIIIDLDIEPILKTFETKYELSELQNIIEIFCKDNSQEDIYGACFSIAAPIIKGKATLSDGEKSVTFSEQDFRQKLPYSVKVVFLNDMEAIGYDIFLSNNEESTILQKIHQPELAPNSDKSKDLYENKVLMLVSDGLGAAKWSNLTPNSSEWGHEDFSGRTNAEKSILQYLEDRKKYYKDDSPVSREYALSKRGLQRIYQSLENPAIYDNQSFSLEPEIIVEQGLQGDSLSNHALELFMNIWGGETGNLALTFKAEAIYIVTDLPIPLHKFQEGSFMKSLLNKEPERMGFREFLNKIPIFLIQQSGMGIWGCARYAISNGFVSKGKYKIMRAKQ